MGLHLTALALPRQADADLDQIAHDGVDVAAHVAHLGELGGLHLQERRTGETGEAARNLGLSATGGADHEDVFGQHLLAQILGELLAPPAVAQCDGDGTLGISLADDVAVELGHDFAGEKCIGWDRSLSIHIA